jgi:hypothetical protein
MITKLGSSLFIASVTLLALNFHTNIFSSANQEWFENHEVYKYGERYVVARLIEAQQNGVFSKSGLVGGYTNTRSHHRIYTQNQALRDNQRFKTYKSQIGGQAITFATIDRITPFTNQRNIQLFRLGTATLTAIVLSLFILWLYVSFGFGSAVIVLISTLFSQWITVYGNNIFWSLWSFYLPFVTTLMLLYIQQKKHNQSSSFFILSCSYQFLSNVSTLGMNTLQPRLS